MKRHILSLTILFNMVSLYSQNIIEKLDTTIQVKVLILEIEKNSILDNIVDTVISYDIHKKDLCKKDYIYSIEIQKDSLDRGYFFYVGLYPRNILEISNIIGVFERDSTLFLCSNDDLTNGYIKTNKYKEIYYTKEIAYIIDGVRYNNPILELYNPPTWIFIYDNKIKKLELFRADFILPDEIYEKLNE